MAVRVFQFVFGLMLGFPFALGSLILLPNIELMFSESPEQITVEQYMTHYVLSVSPVIGYVAMVVAFFRKSSFPKLYKRLVATGLGIGLLVTLWMALSALHAHDGIFFWDFTSFGLRNLLISYAVYVPLLIVGATLMAKVKTL